MEQEVQEVLLPHGLLPYHLEVRGNDGRLMAPSPLVCIRPELRVMDFGRHDGTSQGNFTGRLVINLIQIQPASPGKFATLDAKLRHV